VTLANKITIARILAIPVFVWLSISYGESVKGGDPRETLRYGAIAVFLIASLSDALDGYIARAFNQRSRLGQLLDPLADKGLLVTALLTLSWSSWKVALPGWVPAVIIARDLIVLGGAALVRSLSGPVEFAPSFLGKCATMMQMILILWVMLQLDYSIYPIAFTVVLVVLSGAGYLVRGFRTFHDAKNRNSAD
jgi:cardiolipin synthase